jgi:2-dehydro-3-deoxy-D-arabinonate dehydratase
MQICRYASLDGRPRLGIQTTDGAMHDLDALFPQRFAALGVLLDAMGQGASFRHDLEMALKSSFSTVPSTGLRLLPVIDQQEVWAAGVTYRRSAEAREDESKQSGVYDRVYAAERPEVFLKATPHRVVGPGETLWFRADSTWNVPEPELALVICSSLRLVGYTVGNDMSSRSIEGENPLYLPQAKVYDRCCSLGPGIVPAWEVPNASDLPIGMTIQRGGAVVFTGSTSTSTMKRRFDELITYLGRHNSFPRGVFLLTGTGIVPPDGFTLAHGDVVTITIPGIGTLSNPVERAPV